MTELIESKGSELHASCERYRVERLSLFGSALRDDSNSGHSDLDFCVEFQHMTPQEHAESYFGLLEKLEDLFARRVETGGDRGCPQSIPAPRDRRAEADPGWKLRVPPT